MHSSASAQGNSEKEYLKDLLAQVLQQGSPKNWLEADFLHRYSLYGHV